MRRDEWEIGDLHFGGEIHQKIDFSIGEHHFLMSFSKILREDADYLAEREKVAGFPLPEASYDVKFDREENIKAGSFFEPPPGNLRMSPEEIQKLGEVLPRLLEYHCEGTGAAVYLMTAERRSLKRFYDRLAKQYAAKLGYEVYSDLGGGFEYAIKTKKNPGRD